jgi:hypothetical protein
MNATQQPGTSRFAEETINGVIMASLKRSLDSDRPGQNLSTKVYVRSTRSGRVQKIVREVYLRTDIPCSSKLCSNCLHNQPRDAANKGTAKHVPRRHDTELLTVYQSYRSSSRRNRLAQRTSHRAITLSLTQMPF